jgi:enterobacteria phage integrase
MTRPRKHTGLPMYVTPDGRGGYRVRSPFNMVGVRYRDLDAAVEAATLLREAVERERQARLLDAGKATIAGVVDKFITDQVQFMPWKKGTRTNNLAKLNRIKRELGARVIDRTDAVFLDEWLTGFCFNADTWNKWRYALVLIWKFALSRGLARSNEPERVLERSNSLVIEANQKQRQSLTVEGYKAIYACAVPWLKLAMDISLLTLLGRSEVINLKHADFRSDGYLYVIREKVNATSDAAFMRIEITPELEKLRTRALALDNVVCPYLVHRAPDKRKRRDLDSKKGKHWAWVIPNYLTTAFADARDQSGHYRHLETNAKPSFHEIRGLGSRRAEDLGMDQKAISMLMSHSDPKTTRIYLAGGVEALRPEDYIVVRAPLSIAALIG